MYPGGFVGIRTQAIVLPGKSLPLNQFGNIPNSTLPALRREAKAGPRTRRKRARAVSKPAGTVVFLAATVAGNKAGIGGYFRRLAGHHLTRLTAFEADTHYTARFGYHGRVETIARALWPAAMTRRLHEAISTAK